MRVFVFYGRVVCEVCKLNHFKREQSRGKVLENRNMLVETMEQSRGKVLENRNMLVGTKEKKLHQKRG